MPRTDRPRRSQEDTVEAQPKRGKQSQQHSSREPPRQESRSQCKKGRSETERSKHSKGRSKHSKGQRFEALPAHDVEMAAAEEVSGNQASNKARRAQEAILAVIAIVMVGA